MPRPVEAFPCGSRSTNKTRCSEARAVARFTAVVVLPTPPFWLARAITRGAARSGFGAGRADLADSKDGGCGVGATWEALHPHCPIARGGRQFLLRCSALREQRHAVGREQGVGVSEQRRKRRQGSRGEEARPRQLLLFRALR